MRLLAAVWRNLRHRARVEHELDEEVRAMFDLLVDEGVRSGKPSKKRAGPRRCNSVASK